MSDAFTWEIGLAYKPLLNGAGCEQDGFFATAGASPDTGAGHDAAVAAGDQNAAAFQSRAYPVYRRGDSTEPTPRTPRSATRTARAGRYRTDHRRPGTGFAGSDRRRFYTRGDRTLARRSGIGGRRIGRSSGRALLVLARPQRGGRRRPARDRTDSNPPANLARASPGADRDRSRRPGRSRHRSSPSRAPRRSGVRPHRAQRRRAAPRMRDWAGGSRTCQAAAIRPSRRVRPQSTGMSSPAIARPEPTRPGDADLAGQPAATRRPKYRRTDPAVRSRRRRRGRYDRRD